MHIAGAITCQCRVTAAAPEDMVGHDLQQAGCCQQLCVRRLRAVQDRLQRGRGNSMADTAACTCSFAFAVSQP